MKRFGMHEWLMKAVASPPTSASIDVRLSTSQMRILRLPSVRRSASARPILSPTSSATLRPRRKCPVAKQPRPSIDDGRTSSRCEPVAIKTGDAWHLPGLYDDKAKIPSDCHDGYVAATLGRYAARTPSCARPMDPGTGLLRAMRAATLAARSPGSTSASRRLAARSACLRP
jgi:hypothetical protein